MPELPGDVDHRAPLVQQQRREAVAQVVRALVREADAFERAGPCAYAYAARRLTARVTQK